MQRLPRIIRDTGFRLTVNRSLNVAFLCASAVCLCLAVLIWLSWGRLQFSVVVLLAPVPVLVLGWGICFRKLRVKPARAAIELDRRLHSREVLVSALQCRPENRFYHALQEQAEGVIATVTVADLIPYRFPVMLLPFAIGCVMLGMVVLAAPQVRVLDSDGEVRAAAKHVLDIVTQESVGEKSNLLDEARKAGEHFVAGVKAASVMDTAALKERFEQALLDEAFRRQLLETLSKFKNAQEVNARLAAGDGDQIRLAVEDFSDAFEDGSEDLANRLKQDLSQLLQEYPAVKTLLLKLEDTDLSDFRDELKQILQELHSDAQVHTLKRTSAAVTALDREARAWERRERGDHEPVAGPGAAPGDAGMATHSGAADPNLSTDEIDPERWTQQHWEKYEQKALTRSSIRMTISEREVVRNYFER